MKCCKLLCIQFITKVKSWKLSGEGEEVSTSGSHEARVYNLVPVDGIHQVGYKHLAAMKLEYII